MFCNWGGYGYTRLHLTEIGGRSRWKRRKARQFGKLPRRKPWKPSDVLCLTQKQEGYRGVHLQQVPDPQMRSIMLQINIWNYTRTFQRNPFFRLCGHSMQRLIGRYTLSISQRKFLLRALFSSSARFLFATRHQIDWEQVYWFDVMR